MQKTKKTEVITMKVIYSDQPIEKSEQSIFLAGPTPRSTEVQSWRKHALEILEELNYKGIVYIPEFSNWHPMEDYIKQINWELEGLQSAKIIVFWVPRKLPEMPAFTTNVEFGYWLKSGKVVYGRPIDAVKTRYLDVLYDKTYNEQPCTTLKETLAKAIEKMKDELC